MVIESIGIGLTLGKAVYDMNKSDKINEQAQKRMVKSFAKIAEANANQKEAEEKMNKAVLRLVNRKRAVLSTSMNDFLAVYEKIMRIQFTESDGIKELFSFTPAVATEVSMQISVIRNMPVAPTITPNVVIGYLVGGITCAITSSIVDDAQRNYDLARMQSKQADVIAQQAENISLAYQAIYDRTTHLTDILTKLNILFVQGISHTSSIIERRGLNKLNYNLEDRKSLAACINLAGTIKQILDVPIIDETCEVTQKSFEMVQLGERCLRDCEYAMET